MATKAEKAIDERVNRAYRETCSGVEVDMMDIPHIFALGRKAVAEGMDDEALKTLIAAFVGTIRKN